MKLERLDDVDRAFVHVDYETQHAPEHKKASLPSRAHTLSSTREHYNPTSPPAAFAVGALAALHRRSSRCLTAASLSRTIPSRQAAIAWQ